MQGEQQAKEEPKKGVVWRNALGIRAAVAAAEGGTTAGTREQERVGIRAGLTNRFRRASTASCDETVHHQEEQQPNHQDSVYSRAAAIINTAMRMPSVAGSAAGVTDAGAAAAAVASPAPVPSYLQWPSKIEDAAEPENEGADRRNRKRNTKKELPLGVGSRAGLSGANGEDTTTGSDEEGSLGAAKSSRGGGGAAAVSLSFREAMFAGAVSRSIAQVRCLRLVGVSTFFAILFVASRSSSLRIIRYSSVTYTSYNCSVGLFHTAFRVGYRSFSIHTAKCGIHEHLHAPRL